MTTKHPAQPENRHDYLPAAGLDALLPGYDLLSRVLGAPELHRRLIEQAELADEHRILEIGCGTGTLTVRAKRTQPGAELVGSDPDPRALARAERKVHGLNGIRFEQGYAQELPYPDGSFDRVLSAMMLHHLSSEVRTAAAAEIARVLRPGGRLHLVDIGGRVTGAEGPLGRLMLRNGHLTESLGDGIPRLLRAAGLDCTEVATMPHWFMGRLTFYRAAKPH